MNQQTDGAGDEGAGEPSSNEVSVTPTAELRFKGGVLHQVFMVHREDGSSTPELRPVPDEESQAAEAGTSDSGADK